MQHDISRFYTYAWEVTIILERKIRISLLHIGVLNLPYQPIDDEDDDDAKDGVEDDDDDNDDDEVLVSPVPIWWL